MTRRPNIVRHLNPGQPEKPGDLSLVASREWDRLLSELAASGLRVAKAHRALLSLAANIAADIAEAQAAIQTRGAYITGKAGLVAHPAAKRLDALRRDRIRLLKMLGHRPAGPKKPRDAGPSFDELLDE